MVQDVSRRLHQLNFSRDCMFARFQRHMRGIRYREQTVVESKSEVNSVCFPFSLEGRIPDVEQRIHYHNPTFSPQQSPRAGRPEASLPFVSAVLAAGAPVGSRLAPCCSPVSAPGVAQDTATYQTVIQQANIIQGDQASGARRGTTAYSAQYSVLSL